MYEKIENIDECLYNHVNFELGSFGYGLMESHGYYDDISDLVNPIVKLISNMSLPIFFFNSVFEGNNFSDEFLMSNKSVDKSSIFFSFVLNIENRFIYIKI